jgi:hypothetical protein
MHGPHRAATSSAVAALALLLAACAASPVEQARFHSRAGIETHPVTIVAVDGAAVQAASATSASMAPGLRKVTVQMPAAAGFKPGETRTIDLDVKACTQYWLVAARDKRTGGEYDVKVDHEKRDHRCARVPG